MDVTCNVIEDLLPLYADGICSEDSRTIVEHHVAVCPECKAKLEAMTAKLEPDKSDKIPAEPKNPFKKTRTHYVRLIVITICICALIAIPAIGVMILTINEEYDRGYSWSEIKFESQLRKLSNMIKKGNYREFLDSFYIPHQDQYTDEEMSAFKDMFAEDMKNYFEKYPVKKIIVEAEDGKGSHGNLFVVVQNDLFDKKTKAGMSIDVYYPADSPETLTFCDNWTYIDIDDDSDELKNEESEAAYTALGRDFPDINLISKNMAKNFFDRMDDPADHIKISSLASNFYTEENWSCIWGSSELILDILINLSEETENRLRRLLESYEYIECIGGDVSYMREDIYEATVNRFYCQSAVLRMRSKDSGEEFTISFDMPVVGGYMRSSFRNISYSDNAPEDFVIQFESIFAENPERKYVIYPSCVHDLKTYTEPEVRKGRYYLNGDVDSYYIEISAGTKGYYTMEIVGIDLSELYDSWKSWEEYTEGVSGEIDYVRADEDKDMWIAQWSPKHFRVKTFHNTDDSINLLLSQTYTEEGYPVNIGIKVKDERTLTGFGKDGDFILVED